MSSSISEPHPEAEGTTPTLDPPPSSSSETLPPGSPETDGLTLPLPIPLQVSESERRVKVKKRVRVRRRDNEIAEEEGDDPFTDPSSQSRRHRSRSSPHPNPFDGHSGRTVDEFLLDEPQRSQRLRRLWRRLRIPLALTVAVAAVSWFAWNLIVAKRTEALVSAFFTAAQEKDWTQVQELVDRRGDELPDTIEILRVRIEAARRLNNDAEAARLLETIPREESDAAERYLEAARLHCRSARFGKAAVQLERVLRLRPEDREALVRLVPILAIQQRDADYVDKLWAWHDLPGVKNALTALRMLAEGVPMVQAGPLIADWSDARELSASLGSDPVPTDDPGLEPILERAAESDPESYGMISAQADRLRRAGQLPAALRLLDEGIARSPGDPSLHAVKLLVVAQAGDAIESDAELKRTPQVANKDVRYWIARSLIDEQMERLYQSFEAVRRGLELRPHDPVLKQRSLRLAGRLKEYTIEDNAREFLAAAEELVALVRRPDAELLTRPALIRAAELCRAMNRNKEANAWSAMLLQIPEAETTEDTEDLESRLGLTPDSEASDGLLPSAPAPRNSESPSEDRNAEGNAGPTQRKSSSAGSDGL
mgnify:CR=1 FL=1